MHIKTFGTVDTRSLDQLERCMRAGDAEYGVLCADHHPGYSQPIGGAVAYEGFVSPSGVGYDIACLAAGARVSVDGRGSVPIEGYEGPDPVLCWDGASVRAVVGGSRLLQRSSQPTVEVALSNGRRLRATGEHLIRTKLGWTEAGRLRPGDRVACTPFVGLVRTQTAGSIGYSLEHLAEESARSRAGALARRGLHPLGLDDRRLPALMRLAGVVAGDGHLSANGRFVSIHTFAGRDSTTIVEDARRLGFEPRAYTRRKAPHLRPEICVRINSVAFHALLAGLGIPVGKKRWARGALAWIEDVPSWLRAEYLSGFCSADMSSPLLIDGRVANLTIKQVGENDDVVCEIGRVLDSLAYQWSVSARPSSPGRTAYAIQLLGGEEQQLRFFEEVGFCHSAAKRVAAAAVASVAWQRRAVVATRTAAYEHTRELKAAGVGHRADREAVAARFGVPDSLAFHAYHGDRGAPRSPKKLRFEPDHSGEIAWVAVESVTAARTEPVFDVVTSDPAAAFIAEGVVVHNCGNKAVRTDLRSEDLERLGGMQAIMREIERRISFGVGVPAKERVDHPVLEAIRNADFAPQRTLADLAAAQLGTVGSGNHYVNVMVDEADRIWVGVHFGSRGFGYKTAAGFLSLAQGLPFGAKGHEGEMDSPPVLFELGSELGESYLAAMRLAGDYAYAGRDVVVAKVLEILGARAEHTVHNHHNFAWLEEHHGRAFWVVRKGCTPARPDQEGFVGGSMGDESVILEGVEAPENAEALYSTVHGAGRVMSRSQAAGRERRRKLWACTRRECSYASERSGVCPEHGSALRRAWVRQQVKRGVVDWPAVQDRLRAQGVVLVGGGADEAPEVYKRLPEVLAAHGDTIRVKHTLRPLGVAMAGRDIVDPYKD